MLTHQRLQELLSYNPETGKFYWRVSRGCQKAYSEAGVQDRKGYLIIKIDGIRYGAHRLAVLYMTGGFPLELTDHINGIKDDNRWINLRTASRKENSANAKLNKANQLGIKNIRKTPSGRYQVRISGISYGTYEDINLAEAVAEYWRIKLYEQYARHG